MNGLPYYPRYPRDFFDGTNGMTFELKGAYSMLLDLIYMSGGQLYDEPRFIAGHMNCSVRAWNGHRATLIAMGKISVQNGIISNFRADKELIIQRSFQDKQRENGSKPKKNNDLGEAVAKPKASHTDTDTDKNTEDKSSLFLANNGDEEYQDFLSKHPKPRDSGFGLTAWRAAIAAGADPKELTAAAARYAEASKHFDRDKVKFSDNWLTAGGWEKHPPPKVVSSASEAEIMAFWAKAINGTGFIAQSSISPALASKIIAAGLVSADQMKKRGIAA